MYVYNTYTDIVYIVYIEKKKRLSRFQCAPERLSDPVFMPAEKYISTVSDVSSLARNKARWSFFRSFFFFLNWLRTGVGNPIGTEFIWRLAKHAAAPLPPGNFSKSRFGRIKKFPYSRARAPVPALAGSPPKIYDRAIHSVGFFVFYSLSLSFSLFFFLRVNK